MALNPQTNMVYVTHRSNSEGNLPTMSVIDGTTNEVIKTVHLGFTPAADPKLIAVNSVTNMIYVGVDDSFTPANGKSESYFVLHVIEGKTNTIVYNITDKSSSSFHDIAVDSKTNRVYLVQGSDSDGITVIDGYSNKIVYDMSLNGLDGTRPSIALNPEKNTLYVAFVHHNQTQISAINTSTNVSVANITLPRLSFEPAFIGPAPASDIDVNLQTNKVYVTDDYARRIFVLDGETNEIVKTLVNNFTNYPSARLAVDNSTGLVYVLNTHVIGNMEDDEIGQGKLSVIDGATDNIVNYFMVEVSEELAVNPQTHMIYILSTSPDIITVIEGKKDIVLTNTQHSSSGSEASGIKVGHNPTAIAVNSVTNNIYVIYSSSNKVSVIDGTTDKIIDTVVIDGSPPNAIDVDPQRNRIYIVNSTSLIGIDGDTNTAIFNTTISSGSPYRLAVNPQTDMVYTQNFEYGYARTIISAINGTSGRVIGNLTTNVYEPNLALDISTDTIYVPDGARIFAIGGIHIDEDSDDYETTLDYEYNMSGLWGRSLFFEDIAVNPNTNMLYLIDGNDRILWAIDSFTGTVLNNFTLTGFVTDIAVNPQTNIAYMTDRISNTVLIRNLTTGEVAADVSVGVNPQTLAINPQTNRIYVVNKDSSTISVIDGHTSKVIAGVTFDINPSNSGYIECNGSASSSPVEQYTYLSSGSECIAKPNEGFEFVSWEENLGGNSTQPRSVSRPASSWESFVLAITDFFGDKPDEPESKLNITKFGTFTANFRDAPPPIPSEYWIPLWGIIASTIVGWSIPSIIGWTKSKRDVGKLNSYHKQIARLNDDGRLDEKDIEALDQLRNDIGNAYSEGKLNEKHYETLRGEISTLYEEIFRKKISALDGKNNYSVVKRPIQEQMARIKGIKDEVEYAFSKGKINKKHYDLLTKAISNLDGKENASK
jgi:YVTN family beta-propeller protein